MNCKQVNIFLSSVNTSSKCTMVDEYGDYVFYNIPTSLLTSPGGYTFSIGYTASVFTLTSFTQSGNWNACNTGIPDYDPDANSFVVAAGLSNSTEILAIHKLTSDLKSNNLWNQFKAIYPMVGGTESSCKYNLINVNLFTLTFFNSPTFSSTGVRWDGSTQYAATGLIPNSSLSASNTHFSYYSRQNTSGSSAICMGVSSFVSFTFQNIFMTLKNLGNNVLVSNYGTNPNTFAYSSFTSSGYFLASRISTSTRGYRNSGQGMADFGGQTIAAGSLPTREFYIGCNNSEGTPSLYDNRECSFVTIGYGLTASQIDTLGTIVNTFQTTLGRNVY